MDARIRYTKMRIKDAFFQLLGQKELKEITVKEICDIAEINRATFYKHYSDVFDLMEKMEQEYLDDIQDTLNREEQQEREPKEIVLEYLYRIAVLQWPLSLLGGRNGDPQMRFRLSHKLLSILVRMDEEALNTNEEETRVGYGVLETSVGAILEDWIQSNAQTSPDVVCQRIFAVTNFVVEFFFTQALSSEMDQAAQVEIEFSDDEKPTGGIFGRLWQALSGT